jgi:multidrug efflux pump subunit AcrA (membrane-fusion protein)
LKRSEGISLSVGQPLYEVAPVERMIAHLDVLQGELSHVAVGQQVEVSLEAFPGENGSGTIARIHPRSEPRDGASVFVAEVVIENAAGRLRPGMKGTARVTTSNQPIGWIVLHGPWRELVRWFGG